MPKIIYSQDVIFSEVRVLFVWTRKWNYLFKRSVTLKCVKMLFNFYYADKKSSLLKTPLTNPKSHQNRHANVQNFHTSILPAKNPLHVYTKVCSGSLCMPRIVMNCLYRKKLIEIQWVPYNKHWSSLKADLQACLHKNLLHANHLDSERTRMKLPASTKRVHSWQFVNEENHAKSPWTKVHSSIQTLINVICYTSGLSRWNVLK